MQDLTSLRTVILGGMAFVLFCTPASYSQSVSSSMEDLPDAPEVVLRTEFVANGQPGGAAANVAPRYASVIGAGETAQPLSAEGKFVLAARQEFGLGFLVAPAFSGGFSHVFDSPPHYGTNRTAFGKRVGAAALRRAVETSTATGLYAAIFHDDPRYYVLGPRAKFGKRVIYAATRAIITRRDGGGSTLNLPGLLGAGSAQAVAFAIYPERDQTLSQFGSSTATSIAVNAALFEWSEFGGQILGHFRHK